MNSGGQRISLADGHSVKMKEGFWAQRLRVIEKVTIPDVFDKFEKEYGGTFNNFKRVRDGKRGNYNGYAFHDGLVYECIRGASDFLLRNYDEELDRRLDGYIELITQAQEAVGDGYINLYVTLAGNLERWGQKGGNLLNTHELYNAGCVAEAGVHHYRATGKTTMLIVAVKFANHITEVMGPITGVNIVPAHSLPEEAFLRLYRLFKDEPELKQRLEIPVYEERYLDLVKYWLDMRGHHEDRQSFPRYLGEYSVDHVPLTMQSEAVGHSVRAALCYCGMAEYANITGDSGYAAAAKRIWNNIIQRKMHISGGIGAIHSEEKFGYEYQLPNTAYLETCASVALAFFARAMFVHEGGAEYMDVIERALFNNVLSGVSLDGKKYFYRNPLMSDGSEKRWAWHLCPCCPPMLLKVMGELTSYFYGTDGKGVYVNLYGASEAKLSVAGGTLELSQDTAFPWDGAVRLKIGGCPDGGFALRLRIPEYAGKFSVSLNGEEADFDIEEGYASLRRDWKSGDSIGIDLDMKPVFMAAHPYVHDDNGKVALQYGPLLYCIEEADNEMNGVVVPDVCVPELRPSKSLPGVYELYFEDTLYREVTAVPYYAWANRGDGRMQVWLDKENYKTALAEEWGEELYRPYGCK